MVSAKRTRGLTVKTLSISALAIVALVGTLAPDLASAGFESWSTEVEDDPFSGGKKVAVDYLTSIRSGVYIFCDSAQPGINIRAVPGFDYSPEFSSDQLEFKIAIDGNIVHSGKGSTGSVGENLAAIELSISSFDARAFITALKNAKKQVAISDGLSDRSHLLKARGSTKAGLALETCNGK
jgi:hypothetical protein